MILRHALLISLILASSCAKKKEDSTSDKIPVEVAVVEKRDIPFIVKGIGQLVGSVEVDIRAQSTGILNNVLFTDGQAVEEGDLLFVIEQDVYLADLEDAKAKLIEAEAQYRYAVDFAETYGSLVGDEYVSRLQYEQGVQNVGIYKGQIAAALAAIKTAEINLGYTEIRSPIKGYVSQRNYDIGNFIEAGGSQILTTVRKVVPIDVEFSIPSRYTEELRIKQKEHPLYFECYRPGLSEAPLKGSLYFVDNTIDQNTGMILLKGVIPNEDERGWPGEFVRVHLQLKILENVTVVPQGCVIPGQESSHVYVAKEDEHGGLTAELRNVQTGITYQGYTVVNWGLNPGEKIVTDGHGQLYNGATMFIPSQEKKKDHTKA